MDSYLLRIKALLKKVLEEYDDAKKKATEIATVIETNKEPVPCSHKSSGIRKKLYGITNSLSNRVESTSGMIMDDTKKIRRYQVHFYIQNIEMIRYIYELMNKNIPSYAIARYIQLKYIKYYTSKYYHASSSEHEIYCLCTMYLHNKYYLFSHSSFKKNFTKIVGKLCTIYDKVTKEITRISYHTLFRALVPSYEKKLKIMTIKNNENIIDIDYVNIFSNIILTDFMHNVHCVKYKKNFRKWFLASKRYIIEAIFNPLCLFSRLSDDDDLEGFINRHIKKFDV